MAARSLPPLVLLLSLAVALPVLAVEPTETPLERSNRILKEVGAKFDQHRKPEAAKLDALPKPQSTVSLEELAQQFSKPPVAPIQAATYGLMVFVSFSMPPESLQRVVEQSEKTGAQIVFRGFAGNTMMEMSKRVAKLIGNHRVEVSVNPSAFTQFKVSTVPALVIALPTAGEGLDNNGCAQPTQYVKVTGDVGQDYALDMIERRSPAFARAAQLFSRRLVGGI